MEAAGSWASFTIVASQGRGFCNGGWSILKRMTKSARIALCHRRASLYHQQHARLSVSQYASLLMQEPPWSEMG